jgi:hypothetical protein
MKIMTLFKKVYFSRLFYCRPLLYSGYQIIVYAIAYSAFFRLKSSFIFQFWYKYRYTQSHETAQIYIYIKIGCMSDPGSDIKLAFYFWRWNVIGC